jgi:hypothetical protein
VPDRVKVMIRVRDGNNQNFVFEGAGSGQTDRNLWYYRTGGVVFGYSATMFRVWAPSQYPYNMNGYSVFTGESWGFNQQPQSSMDVDCRILAWAKVAPPDYDSGWSRKPMIANVMSYAEFYHNLGVIPARVQVVATPMLTSSSNYGFNFEGQGMAQGDGWYYYVWYGGVVFAYNETTVRVWVPSNNPASPYSSIGNYGRPINVNNGWGGARMLPQNCTPVFEFVAGGTTPACRTTQT